MIQLYSTKSCGIKTHHSGSSERSTFYRYEDKDLVDTLKSFGETDSMGIIETDEDPNHASSIHTVYIHRQENRDEVKLPRKSDRLRIPARQL